jgi:hypothetical protein
MSAKGTGTSWSALALGVTLDYQKGGQSLLSLSSLQGELSLAPYFALFLCTRHSSLPCPGSILRFLGQCHLTKHLYAQAVMLERPCRIGEFRIYLWI